jgi:hypothetical protein
MIGGAQQTSVWTEVQEDVELKLGDEDIPYIKRYIADLIWGIMHGVDPEGLRGSIEAAEAIIKRKEQCG